MYSERLDIEAGCVFIFVVIIIIAILYPAAAPALIAIGAVVLAGLFFVVRDPTGTAATPATAAKGFTPGAPAPGPYAPSCAACSSAACGAPPSPACGAPPSPSPPANSGASDWKGYTTPQIAAMCATCGGGGGSCCGTQYQGDISLDEQPGSTRFSSDALDGDERAVYQASSRNDPRRAIAGMLQRHRSLDSYYRDDIATESQQPWWGNGEE